MLMNVSRSKIAVIKMQSVSTPRAHMNADVGQVTKEMVLTARVSRLLLLLLFSVEIGWCDETG